jgi:GGDEF domain-containing protein
LNREGGSLTAVLFIDVDDLKTVNDNFGHDAGDRVIQTTADRLRRAVRKHDFVGRIRRVLSEPIEIPGGTIQVGASIGVVRTDRADSRDAATLLREADTAMYAAKARGRRASHFSRLSPSRR